MSMNREELKIPPRIIKPKDLMKEQIDKRDIKKFNKLRTLKLVECIAITVLAISMFLGISWMTFIVIGHEEIEIYVIMVLICLMMLGLFLVMINLSSKIISRKNEKSQYGYITNYNSSLSIVNGTTNRSYCVSVKFKDNNTVIRGVECLDSKASKFRTGRKVLVISFSGKFAYAISTKKAD